LKRNGKDISFRFIRRLHEKKVSSDSEKTYPKTPGAYQNRETKTSNGRWIFLAVRWLKTLESYRRLKVSGFLGSEETISFLIKIIKWFEIHDICNVTQAIHKRLPNKAPFTSKYDLRLQWLRDFIKWLEKWKMNAEEKNHFLSDEMYEAIVITTKSTIAKIEHLL
jgi:hypothetical protein